MKGSEKHIAIQLDSICNKLNKVTDWSKHIVFLDEINTIINYMLDSNTLESKRLDIIAKLIEIIQGCKYLLCFDADISDLVIQFLSDFKEKDKILFVKN